MEPSSSQPLARSFYLLPEWVALMEEWCEARAEICEFSSETGAALRTVFFSNRAGIFQPPYMAYAALEFAPTPTQQPARVTRQWHELAVQLIAELQRRGWRRWLTLPPQLPDVRPFVWANLMASPRFTYFLPPTAFDLSNGCSPEIPRKARKSAGLGYVVKRDAHLDAAWHNIQSTQQRQHFEYRITPAHLQTALAKLGPDRFRVYNGYDPHGQPACTIIVLVANGAVALDWIAATSAGHLKSGVTQQVRLAVFDDLRTAQTAGFDFCGANIPTVAAAKSEFGPDLLPYYLVEPPSWRALARLALRCLRSPKP